MTGARVARVVKRAMDILISAAALAFLWPVMGIIAVAILRTMGRPVLFRQTRPGLHGRPFDILKFRTMRESRTPSDELLLDKDRTTSLGRLLRRSSLDELPEFWNILRGEMSLVGPRPLLMEYLDRYSPEQARRHEVRPGLTGWAQINGRRLLQMPERLALDVWYVDHWSLRLDARIMARTVALVIDGSGIEARDAGRYDPGWDRSTPAGGSLAPDGTEPSDAASQHRGPAPAGADE